MSIMHIENVLSVFDGHSGLMISLETAGFTVGNYYSSEIDKHAMKASEACYPNIIRLGDVRNVSGYNLPKISVYGGGSPCQSFSFAGKRKGMSTKCEIEILDLEHYLQLKSESFEFEGQSYLFWEYMRILRELQKVNPQVYFFLENVEMGEKWEKVISKAIGVKGIHINSALVSAQNRRRIYWTNIGMEPGGLFGEMESKIKQPKDRGILLKDILESEVDEKYFLSDKAVQGIVAHKAVQKEKGFGFGAVIKESHQKMNALKCGGKGVDDLVRTEVVVHNTMPRSFKTGKGGTGPLSRSYGKTYCLDTGQTNAIEVIGCDYRTDEGIRYREGGKTGTLAARARNDESCGQLVQITNKRHEANHKNGNEKANAFLSTSYKGAQANGMTLVGTSRIRRLTPRECGRLQTIPEYIIDIILNSGVSDSQIYKMFGNGWNIETIVHILKYMK
jgi:DNA (cytosine-5)-methyltransferase 3A